MEAGYDYLLVRSSLQHKFIRASAIFLLATGAVLLSAGIAYFIYAGRARSDLEDLNVAITPPRAIESPVSVQPASPLASGETTGPTVQQTQPVVPVPANEPGPAAAPAVSGIERTPPVDSTVPLVTEPEPAGPLVADSAISGLRMYPAESIRPSYWESPLEYEPLSYVEASAIQGFQLVDPGSFAPMGTLAAPTGIHIPSIGVETQVEALRILDLGDSRAYETPKHVVGHIPESSNPGEVGSVWLFGHLESPIAGEGNVFYNLPNIPDLLRQGRSVYTVVETDGTDYLYRLTEAFVVHADDLRMDYGYLQSMKPEYAHLDPGGSNVHLVACVPRFVYDSRLVVSGELVGIR